MSVFLDGAAEKTTVRTDEEVLQLSVTVSKAGRAALKTADKKAYQKLADKASKGIDVKLDYFDASTMADIASDTGFSGVQTNLKALTRHINVHQLDDVFKVPARMTEDATKGCYVPVVGSEVLDLRADYSLIPIDLLKNWAEYVRKYGPDYMVENIVWSEKAILDSCEKRLKIKINEQLDKVPPQERGGPVAFKIMMTYVLSTSNEALRALIVKLGVLKLTDFDGENVIQACTFIENLSIMLKDNDMTPKDFDESVHAVFKDCSCPDFVKFVEALASNMKFGIKEYETSEYLALFEAEYTTKSSAGKWPAKSAKTGKNASFGAFKEGGRDMSKTSCLNCMETGHMVKDCPKAIDQEAIAKNKKIIFRNSDTRRTAGGGSNGGNNDDSKKTVNPRRVPPGPNDPKEKKFGDKNLKWCGKCGIWTYHSTDEHKTKAELEEEKSNKSEGANASTSGLSYAGATALNF